MGRLALANVVPKIEPESKWNGLIQNLFFNVYHFAMTHFVIHLVSIKRVLDVRELTCKL